MLENQSKQRAVSISQQSPEKTVAGVDPSWKGLYRVGGISAILYIILALVAPLIPVLMKGYFESTAEYGGLEFLRFIAANRLWWFSIQTLVLGTSILMIVAFVALFVALKPIDKINATLGAVISVVIQILFIAYYPVLLGTIYLSDKFVTASAEQQIMLGAAADSLMAINNAFNPLYEPLMGVGILFFSIAMLKGVFHKSIGYLGIATCIVCFIAVALWPVLSVNYFWWWSLFVVWFIAVGWKLFQLGKK